ncbi:uncharacterized protein [Setaria viridis]|uniref:Uncharacterized protein n=1 Tax=Setaria viridis TaxID=4556 RepID=A0A4U6W0D0_SETVI|nr:hypothetical protein SEVIR_2G364600v2 [Setaria viridis]
MRSICPALNSPRPPPVPHVASRGIASYWRCLPPAPRSPLLTSQKPRHRELAAGLAPLRIAAALPLYKKAPNASRLVCWCCWSLGEPGRERNQKGIKEREGMVFFCFLVDQRRTVRSSKPAAGICSRCGGCASVADMETSTRVCYLLTVHRRTWRAIICTFCGAMLKSYRHYRLY